MLCTHARDTHALSPAFHHALRLPQCLVWRHAHSFKDMQLWASNAASRHLAKHITPQQCGARSKETRHTQRAVGLSTPIGGRQDAVISAYAYQPKWKHIPKNQKVLSALSPGAQPLASSAASAQALPWPSLASEPLDYCSSLDRTFSGRGLRAFRPEAALGRDSTFYLSYCKPRHGRSAAALATSLAAADDTENRRPATAADAVQAEAAAAAKGVRGGVGGHAAASSSAAPTRQRLRRPHSASVLQFYDIDHYSGRGRAGESNIKVGAEGRLQTRWSSRPAVEPTRGGATRQSRVSAGEPFAGRAWGPIVVDVYRETRKPDEW